MSWNGDSQSRKAGHSGSREKHSRSHDLPEAESPEYGDMTSSTDSRSSSDA